jgi:hypothetical protein
VRPDAHEIRRSLRDTSGRSTGTFAAPKASTVPSELPGAHVARIVPGRLPAKTPGRETVGVFGFAEYDGTMLAKSRRPTNHLVVISV